MAQGWGQFKSVLAYVMPIFFCTSICLAQCCFCVYVVIVLNGYWHVAALYALWLYLDWDTPQAGGRRSDWVRHWTVWKHFRDYFPIHVSRLMTFSGCLAYTFNDAWRPINIKPHYYQQ